MNRKSVRLLFQDTANRLADTLGEKEGVLVLGHVLSYAAAAAVFQTYRCFPGMVLHGGMGAGKSTVARWLMPIWSGIYEPVSLRHTTPGGLLNYLEGHHDVPIWLDEFRNDEVSPALLSLLRATFDRQLPAKWIPAGERRQINSTPIILAQAPIADAATASRFLHVEINPGHRKQNHLTWFFDHRLQFQDFIVAIQQQHAVFVNAVLKRLSPSRDREQFIPSIATASFEATKVILQ